MPLLSPSKGKQKMKTNYITKYKLTQREHEVWQLLAQGYSDKEICERLVLAHSTVTTHKNKIYEKLSISGPTVRIQAVIIYFEQLLSQETKHLRDLMGSVQKENARLVRQNRELQSQLKEGLCQTG